MSTFRRMLRQFGRVGSESPRRDPRRGSLRRKRMLQSEVLERRQLLAADAILAHNSLNNLDVDFNFRLTANDALTVINYLKENGSGELVAESSHDELPPGFVDVNGDGMVSASDALLVVNGLASGEGVDPFIELTLDATELDNETILEPDSIGDINVMTDEIFLLDLGFFDLRSPLNRQGLVQFIADIGVSTDGVLVPALSETQSVVIGPELVSDELQANPVGTVTVSIEGQPGSVDIPMADFIGGRRAPAETIADAMITLGVPEDSFETRFINNNGFLDPEDPPVPVSVEIRYLVLDQDFPPVEVVISGTPQPISTEVIEIEPRNPDGSINNDAIGPNLITDSREEEAEYFDGLNSGSFGPTGFENVTGSALLNGEPSEAGFGNSTPFDSLKIPVRITQDVQDLVIDINPNNDEQADINDEGLLVWGGIVIDPGPPPVSSSEVPVDGVFTDLEADMGSITRFLNESSPAQNIDLTTFSVDGDGRARITINATGDGTSPKSLSVVNIVKQNDDQNAVTFNGTNMMIDPSVYAPLLGDGDVQEIIVTFDMSDGNKTVSYTASVSINGEGEGSSNDPPVMDDDTGVNVPENTTAVGTFDGTDPDGDTLTYSLSGADAALFNIDSSTGAVSFIAAPDFENPADAGADNVYNITVTATDDGVGNLTDSQNVTVTVTNVNEAPVMPADTGVNVEENTTAVGTFAGTDPDAGDTLTYALSGVDAALFNIDSSTGEVSFIDPPNLETPLDDDGDNVYEITVTATDDGDGMLSDSQNVAVTVTDQNEPPVMPPDTGVNVPENTTAVGTFAGTDPDPGDTLTYTLSGVDAGLFSINSSTGAVSFIAAPDFESPSDAGGNNVYDITVTATDNGTGMLSDSQDVTVTVTDVNESPNMPGDTGVSVPENTTAVGTFDGTDPDAGDTLTYSLSGDDAGLFDIDGSTGTVSFISAPDFENPADADGNNVYEITVTATDDDNLSDGQNVAVTVTDVNEAPSMPDDDAVNVPENTTAVGTFDGSDPDAGDTLTYSLSGVDAGLFDIDSSTGAVSFANAPDFENPADDGGNNVYDITVTVTDDDGLSDSQDVEVTVTNVNEAPVMPEDATVNVSENTTAVGTFTGADEDAGDTLDYSLSGVDAALFSINSSTGAVSFLSPPDLETPLDDNGDNIYEITVTATDDGGESDSQNIDVRVTDENEPPVMPPDTGVSVPENTTAVGTFTGTDPDPGDTLSYSLSGVDAALFSINSSTGAVSFISAPDFENPADAGGNNVYDITVTATDNGSGNLTDSQDVTVTVTDVNEAPDMPADTGVSVVEGTTSVGTFTGTDPDANDTLTYSLTGVDAALFNINSSTGAVSFITAPDFLNPMDDDGDNVYDIDVVATDDGDGMLTDSQNVLVTVTQMPNIPPEVEGPIEATFSEEDPIAMVDLLNGASDPDGQPQPLSVDSVVINGDGSGIEINGSTLSIDPSAYGRLVQDQSEVITVTYSITDGRGSVAQTATIRINGFNDPPVARDDEAIAFSGSENTIVVLDNDDAGDDEVQELTVISASSPNGDAEPNADGTISFTPANGFLGDTTISYTIRDEQGKEASATVDVEVVDFVPSKISGYVFIDLMENIGEFINGADPIRNGVKEDDERGLAGVTVQLVGGGITRTEVTDINGMYCFDNLAPGEYEVIYGADDDVIFIGDGDLEISIGPEGGADEEQVNFPLLGTQGSALTTLDILASTYLASNPAVAAMSGGGLEGGVVSLDDDCGQEFFIAGEGFDGVAFAEIALNEAMDQALLTILMEGTGEVLSAVLTSDEFIISSDGKGVQFFGGLDDHDFIDPGQDLTEQFACYRKAVDEYLAGM